MDITTIRAIVNSTINSYANDTVTVYKRATSTNPSIYRDPDVTYEDGVDVVGVVRTDPDMDLTTALGKADKEDIKVTFAIDELQSKFPLLSTATYIQTSDVLKFEDVYYAVYDVKITGRVFGQPTSILS